MCLWLPACSQNTGHPLGQEVLPEIAWQRHVSPPGPQHVLKPSARCDAALLPRRHSNARARTLQLTRTSGCIFFFVLCPCVLVAVFVVQRAPTAETVALVACSAARANTSSRQNVRRVARGRGAPDTHRHTHTHTHRHTDRHTQTHTHSLFRWLLQQVHLQLRETMLRHRAPVSTPAAAAAKGRPAESVTMPMMMMMMMQRMKPNRALCASVSQRFVAHQCTDCRSLCPVTHERYTQTHRHRHTQTQTHTHASLPPPPFGCRRCCVTLVVICACAKRVLLK